MNRFYLYINRGKDLTIKNCEKITVPEKDVIKVDKLFNFEVFIHQTKKSDLKIFVCTEVQTGMSVCKASTLEDCLSEFDKIKKEVKLKDVAQLIGRGKAQFEELKKQFNL